MVPGREFMKSATAPTQPGFHQPGGPGPPKVADVCGQGWDPAAESGGQTRPPGLPTVQVPAAPLPGRRGEAGGRRGEAGGGGGRAQSREPGRSSRVNGP